LALLVEAQNIAVQSGFLDPHSGRRFEWPESFRVVRDS